MRPGGARRERPAAKTPRRRRPHGYVARSRSAAMPSAAPTATIGSVARARGELTKDQTERLHRAIAAANRADNEKRDAVVAVLAEGASFAEVSKATGLST